MRLSFEDANGQTGVVTDDLTVEYAGEWVAQVQACVERLENEQRCQDGADQGVDVYSHLVIDLPNVAPIVAVEREPKTVSAQ